MNASLAQKRDQLLASIEPLGSCVVAMSAGVDSSLVAKAAQLALGEQAVAVTAVSPSLAEGELQIARDVAAQIGIRHETIATDEMSAPAYVANSPDRCYHCKSELYAQLESIAEHFDTAVILNGTNADDATDFRPGMKAAVEHRVRSPLAECGFSKAEIRELAAHWNLSVWDKHASPCLSSRIAYGEEVTPGRLRMVDRAEQLLRSHGFDPVRVRYHHGDVARIEIPLDAIAVLSDEHMRSEIVNGFKQLGFKYIAIDLEGFRSGSLNEVVSIDVLQKYM